VIHQNVYISIALTAKSSHFKFYKAVIARISGEVGILCIALSSVYFRTQVPIFIEACSHLTDTEQKKSWHVFLLRRGVYYIILSK